VKSKLRLESRKALLAANQRLRPELRVQASIAQSRVIAHLQEAGRRLRERPMRASGAHPSSLTCGATGVSGPTRSMRDKETGRSVRSAPQCLLIENGNYFWCEQATSYWETLFGLPEFCGC
jgi:hypothetical protein